MEGKIISIFSRSFVVLMLFYLRGKLHSDFQNALVGVDFFLFWKINENYLESLNEKQQKAGGIKL